MSVAVFKKQPTSVQFRTFLGRLYAKAKPRYIISDKGPQFSCDGFKAWCKRKHIKPRFGAIGRYGSIAVIERFIRTLKDEGTRRIAVPYRREKLRQDLITFSRWYNEHRPHEFDEGRTPNEVYYGRPAESRKPRIEVRADWPAEARCARPAAAIDGEPGQKVELVLRYHAGRKHLPIVQLRRVAQPNRPELAGPRDCCALWAKVRRFQAPLVKCDHCLAASAPRVSAPLASE